MLKVMSFNLRYGTAQDDENSWKYRKDLMIEMLKKYHPDIIGSQEGLKFQFEYITSKMPEYQFFGVSRRGTDEDEFSAIIYNSKTLKLIDGDNFWLSETPDVPGSQSWGSSLPRMVTWVLLETKEGKRFYHYNTHLDHRSEEARRKSAILIWRKVQRAALPVRELAGQPALPVKQDGSLPGKSSTNDLPVILTGDFNATNESFTWNIFTGKTEYEGEKPDFIDSWNLANSTKGNAKLTYHGFKGEKAEENWKERTGQSLVNRRRIDWILLKGKFRVNLAEIVTYNKDGRYPSDHYPVYAEFIV